MTCSPRSLRLLLLLTLLGPLGCGTEIGNPLYTLFGGNSGSGSTASAAPLGVSGAGTLYIGTVTGDAAAHCELPPAALFTDSGAGYTTHVAAGWQSDSSTSATVLFDKQLTTNNSAVQIRTETVTTPIGDLLAYLNNSQPGIAWVGVVNAAGLDGVMNQETTHNDEGSSLYTVYYAKETTLVRLDLVLNLRGDGDKEGSCLANFFLFF